MLNGERLLLFFLSEAFGGSKISNNSSVRTLEQELESFLMNLEGVGNCDVLIYG